MDTIRFLENYKKNPRRLVVGCLSGTSMDGLDVAICRIEGSGRDTGCTLLHFETVPYPDEIRSGLAEIAFKKEMDAGLVCRLNTEIGRLTGETILAILKSQNKLPSEIHAVGSHGQTIFHAPDPVNKNHGTLQIGDGDQISRITGIPVVCDFRQKHIAAGGEGAPITAYGDRLLFSHTKENRILLNIGGIANITWLPASQDPGAIICGDTGPGNTLIDAFVRLKLNQPFDPDGTIAAGGKIHEPLLRALKDDPWFLDELPKTTGPEKFSVDYVEKRLKDCDCLNISTEDLLAVLTRFTSETITDQIAKVTGGQSFTVYVGGGGVRNRTMMKMLKELLGGQIYTSEKLGIPPDAKEAVLFAVLTNETLAGDGFPAPDGKRRFNMGKISMP